MTISGVSNVWFPVSDVDRAKTFYVDVLGLSERETDGDWAEIQAGDLIIGLNARDSEEVSSRGGGVVAFAPEGSIDDEVERLQAAGVEFAGGVTDHPWGRIAAFRDPDGHDLQLFEPPSG